MNSRLGWTMWIAFCGWFAHQFGGGWLVAICFIGMAFYPNKWR